MTNDDFDPVVPFWGADADLTELYLEHARHGPELDQVLDTLWLNADAIAPAAAAMRGTCRGAALLDHCYWRTFTPGGGDCLALVVPVHEDGRMVDMVACGDFDRGWGAVTGRGDI